MTSIELKAALEKLAALRARLRDEFSATAVHRFAKAVEGLGYFGEHDLAKSGVDFGSLVGQVYRNYRRVLEQNPDEAAALNNIGVFLCNGGRHRRALAYFLRAAELSPKDATVHENVRIAHILMRKPRSRWHDYPAKLKRGKHTLCAYFDPHGM